MSGEHFAEVFSPCCMLLKDLIHHTVFCNSSKLSNFVSSTRKISLTLVSKHRHDCASIGLQYVHVSCSANRLCQLQRLFISFVLHSLVSPPLPALSFAGCVCDSEELKGWTASLISFILYNYFLSPCCHCCFCRAIMEMPYFICMYMSTLGLFRLNSFPLNCNVNHYPFRTN